MIDTAELKQHMQKVAAEEFGMMLDAGVSSGDHVMYHCPLHNDKTPSFAVYADHFYCYSCTKSGDVITFIQVLHNKTFREACEYLGADQTDRQALDQWQAEREAARKADEAKKQAARDNYHTSGPWMKWHQALDAPARAKWRGWGIPDSWQDYWKLGFCPDRVYQANEKLEHSPAFTMPIWSYPNGVPSHVQTSQYRLTNPVEGAGKFRFEKDLGTAGFITRNDWRVGETDGKDPLLLVVEGPRKAATVRVLADPKGMQVIGIPSKGDTGGLLESFKHYAWVYVWLDPDVIDRPANALPTWEPWDIRLVKAIGVRRSSYVRIGEKIDDALLAGHLDKWSIQRLLHASERVV